MLKELQEAIDMANRGEWEEAHTAIQDLKGFLVEWFHANLHREEGNLDNANYWYDKANIPFSDLSVDEERNKIEKKLKEIL